MGCNGSRIQAKARLVLLSGEGNVVIGGTRETVAASPKATIEIAQAITLGNTVARSRGSVVAGKAHGRVVDKL